MNDLEIAPCSGRFDILNATIGDKNSLYIWHRVKYLAEKRKLRPNLFINMEPSQLFETNGGLFGSVNNEDPPVRRHTCSSNEIQVNVAPKCQGGLQMAFLLSPPGFSEHLA